MRRLAAAVGLAGLLTVPVAHASVSAKSPCALVTAIDAKRALGAAVGKPKAQTLGLFQSCTYATPTGKVVTVQTRRIDRATFVKSAKANPAPVKPVAGLGGIAFSAAGGSTLLVWKHGTAVTLLILGTPSPLASEKQLAKKALARL
jgi:hypothetical protein